MIRVLVAEDSLTVRELLVTILESDPELKVVGQAKSGAEAVELAAELRVDVITMDVHMPVMDGFEATKEIMIRSPTPIVIVSSSTSQREVELSLNAMRAGALIAVGKPDDPHASDFDVRRQQLVTMVKAMAHVKVVRRWARPPRPGRAVRPPRAAGEAPVRLVVVATSTGGPAALQHVLGGLPGDFAVPIVVVQHIATGFIAGVADWLNASCDLRVKVAESGDRLEERTVYLAPDDRQCGIASDGRIVLTDAPPLDGFRPSGTYLFESAARACGAGVLALVLTGMGSDGVAGLKAVKAAGGRVLAQDEETSVVYGMPQEAVRAGVVDAVVPLGEMAARVRDLSPGGD